MSALQIVLIEDNPADVFLVRMALEESGVDFAMTTFDDGEEAVRSFRDAPSGAAVPDAILLDLNTPKSDGFEVLTRLKETAHLADVPIAILTSSQASSDKERASRLGATRFILKPSQLDEFLTQVGEAVKEILVAKLPSDSPPPNAPAR